MPTQFHLDFETYSTCDIDLGAYRYASDPSTRILLCAVARGDEPPVLWASSPMSILGRPPENEKARALLLEMVYDHSALIYAHNSQFEIAVCRYLFSKTFDIAPPDLGKWRCTASMCRRAAIPWSLAKAAEYLGLPALKMTAGRSLIKLFSLPPDGALGDPGKKITIDGVKTTVGDAWDMFGEYCVQDVVVEREIHKRLKAFEMTGMTLEGFQLDIRMNDRGVPVDKRALGCALDLMQDFYARTEIEFEKLSGLRPAQTAAVLGYLEGKGYDKGNLQAATIEEELEDPMSILDSASRRLLDLKRLHSYAAVKKIPTMLASACADGRVRGAFMWSGAIRTHRWAGRLIQPQNFKRATFKDTHVAFDMIRKGESLDTFSVLWGSPMEVLASSIRHFIADPEDMLIDADFASIEARVAPWLAGQGDMVEEFRRGEPLYETMASAIFSVPVDEVTSEQRFVGKTASLGCQFGMSWRKFQTACRNYGKELPDKICQLAVYRYRKRRDQIVRAWKQFQITAVLAVNNPGTMFFPETSIGKISFSYGRIGGFPALAMYLPSGHMLVYPEPTVVAKEVTADILQENEAGELVNVVHTFVVDEVSFYGPIPLKTGWGRIHTHGGKLFENAVQATAGDFMTHSLIQIERAGFEPFATIHDQVLCPMRSGSSAVTFEKVFTRLPAWASDFPLEASVKITPFYQKT